MGLPMIQVFMIAARQVSKPIADAVIKYGKDHPKFRSKVLIPVGRAIVRLTTRLRMKRLGLGETTTTQVQVSEAAALEQASDFVQQVVLFSYSVGVFAGYYFYTKMTTPETVKLDEFNQYRDESNKVIEELKLRVAELEKVAAKKEVAQKNVTEPAAPASRFPRISSLPVDSAVKLLVKDDDSGEVREYLVVRRGSSVGIELADVFRERGEKLSFRKKEVTSDVRPDFFVSSAQRFVRDTFGFLPSQ